MSEINKSVQKIDVIDFFMPTSFLSGYILKVKPFYYFGTYLLSLNFISSAGVHPVYVYI